MAVIGLALAVLLGGCASWEARRDCEARWDKMVERRASHDALTAGMLREGEALAKAEFMEQCLRGR